MGKFTPEARVFFGDLIGRMRGEEGCDAVGMCCTELPLLLKEEETLLPWLDSTRLLARAALRAAVNGDA